MNRTSQVAPVRAATLPGVNSPRPFPPISEHELRRLRAECYLHRKGVDPYYSGPSPRLIDWITGLAMLGIFLAFGAAYLLAGAVG